MEITRQILNPPYTIVKGREWKVNGGGSTVEGNFQSKVSGSSNGSACPQETCGLDVVSIWKNPLKPGEVASQSVVVNDDDATPNLDVKLKRDPSGEGYMQIHNVGGGYDCTVNVRLGSIDPNVDGNLFDRSLPCPQPIRSVELQQHGGEGQVRLNGQPYFVMSNGRLFQES